MKLNGSLAPCLAAAIAAVLGTSGCTKSSDAARVPAPAAQKHVSLQQACGAFAAGELPHGAKVEKTELRAAQGMLPEACIVRGSIVTSPNSTINWAVELPASDVWNGKALMFGGGGFDGFAPIDADYYRIMSGRSADPYVKMGSDSGHQVRAFFPWGLDDDALKNHAYEANHLTLQVGTQIATEFYGKAPTRRYMFGQSNGGRSGLIATQRYPKDYDGIIAIEPAVNQQAHQINLSTESVRHIFSNKQNWLSKEKVALFAQAEIKACDALDGLADGVIGNVAACNYVPVDLRCKGTDNDTCLTDGQIETIRRIYSDHKVPVTLADGLTGYPRYGRGGAATSDWNVYMFGTSFEARDSFNYMATHEAAKVVENSEQATPLTHEPSKYAAQYNRLSKEMDLIDPDLSQFASNGGKLLIWYGVADTCVSIYRTAEYFDRIKQRMGAAKVAEFARFLNSPGVGHNLDGPGTAAVDLIVAMDNWVENSVAPDQLVAAKLDTTTWKPVFERPVCEFPKFPRYKGSGDAAKADSFVCAES